MEGFFLLMSSCLAHHLDKSYASSLTARAAPTAKQRPLQSRDIHGNRSSGSWLNPGDWIGYLERKKTSPGSVLSVRIPPPSKTYLYSTSSSDCKVAASAKQRYFWKLIVRPMAQPRRLDRIFGEPTIKQRSLRSKLRAVN